MSEPDPVLQQILACMRCGPFPAAFHQELTSSAPFRQGLADLLARRLLPRLTFAPSRVAAALTAREKDPSRVSPRNLLAYYFDLSCQLAAPTGFLGLTCQCRYDPAAATLSPALPHHPLLQQLSAAEIALELSRVPCPCCRFRTMEGRGEPEICPLCDWEDGGVRGGGPMAVLFTADEARLQFQKLWTIYPVDARPQPPAVTAWKRQLAKLVQQLAQQPDPLAKVLLIKDIRHYKDQAPPRW